MSTPRDRAAYDAAEIFARLASIQRQRRPQRLELSRWRRDKAVEARTQELARSILDLGLVTAAQVPEADGDPKDVYVLLRAIDRAFAHIDPYSGVRDAGRLSGYRRTFRRMGRYNEDARCGAVVPRRTFPTRPQVVPDHEADHLQALMLLERPPDHVHFRLLPPELDFSEGVRDEETLVVGCVPFLATLDELEIRRIDDAESWYAIQARTADEEWAAHWGQRIRRVLDNLDRSGAHIGLVPELALTDEMLGWWKEAVRHTQRQEGSRLEWILVGSGPITVYPGSEQQPNRAVLLHRDTGAVVMEQDKCEAFTLTQEHIDSWQLADHLGTGSLSEWMREGRDRYVVDARICRLAILICEDHARLLKVGAELANLAPSLLLIPLFAPPIIRHHWQEQAAKQFANTTGSASVMATSRAVTLAPGAHRAPHKPEDEGTALALMPTQSGPSDKWSARAVIGDEGDPTEVVTFELPRC